MGVASFSSVLHTLDKLTLHQVYKAAKSRASAAGRSDEPTIYVDGSLLLYRYRKHAGGAVIVADVLSALVKEGFCVVIVFDPDTRHHSKLASIMRRGERESARIQALYLKPRIMLVSGQLRSEDLSNDQREFLKKELIEYEAKIKTCQNKTEQEPDNNFKDRVVQQVLQMELGDRGGSIKTAEAPFQADSYIAWHILRGRCDIVMGSDTDYSVMGGRRALMLTNFTFRVRDSQFLDAVFKCSDIATLRQHVSITTNNTLQVAGNPLLDGVECARTRMAVAVACGCDTLPGGIANSGPAKLKQLFGKLKKDHSLTELLQQLEGRNPKFGSLVLETFIDAWYFEPAILSDDGKFKYMFEAPIKIDIYLQAFGQDKTTFDKNLSLVECHGHVGQASHVYPENAGTRVCSKCQTQTCKYCTIDIKVATRDEKKSKEYIPEWKCLKCCSSAAPETNALSAPEMKSAILQKGWGSSLTDVGMGELLELYHTIVEEDALQLGSHSRRPKYPLYPSNGVMDGTLALVTSFDFKEGGRFIQDPRLTIQHVIGVSNLLASVVSLSNKFRRDGLTNQEDAMYATLPDIIIQFAQQLRPGNNKGYRLMQRCQRHALDEKTRPLDCGASADIFTVGNNCRDVGLTIKHSIQPSYRLDKRYAVSVSFTVEDFLCTSCSCKAGPDGAQQHSCVHSLPLILLLTLFLFDGFADHFLCELSARLSVSVEAEMTCDEKKICIQAIQTLIQAASDDHVAECLSSITSPVQLLERFQVGTERPKKCPPPPDPEFVIPLENMQFVSTKKRIALKLQRAALLQKPHSTQMANITTTGGDNASASSSDDDSCGDPDIEEEDDKEQDPPNYLFICAMQHAFFEYLGRPDNITSDLVGFKVLKIREEDLSIYDRVREIVRKDMKEEMLNKAIPSTTKRACNRSNAVHYKQCDNKNTKSPFASCGVTTNIPETKRHRNACCMYDATCPLKSNLKRVPVFPTIPPNHPKLSKRVLHGKRKYHRAEIIRRAKLSPSKRERTNLRICDDHEWETVTKSYPYVHETIKKLTKTKTAKFRVPKATGQKALTTTLNGGLGFERRQSNLLSQAKAGSWELTSQQQNYFGDPNAVPLSQLNQRMVHAAGLSQHKLASDAYRRNLNNLPPTSKWLVSPPIVSLDIVDDEVKDRTGFPSLYCLLSFVAIAVDGRMESLLKTTTKLTWFEEWFVFFEWIWGREARTRKSLARKYKVSRGTINPIIDKANSMIMSTISRWPRFISLREDRILMAPCWREAYPDIRPIMWDDTNARLPAASDPNINRATFSSYYADNVAKGGIFLQLCGWMGAWTLFAGSISDTDYMTKGGVFEFQDNFVKDCPDHPTIPFTNICDKGYRCGRAAWRAGKQLLIQPAFAKSDRKFNTSEVMHSSSVSSDRSANERAVKAEKYSDKVKRGLEKRERPKTFADAWINWGFMCNFIFRRVL